MEGSEIIYGVPFVTIKPRSPSDMNAVFLTDSEWCSGVEGQDCFIYLVPSDFILFFKIVVQGRFDKTVGPRVLRLHKGTVSCPIERRTEKDRPPSHSDQRKSSTSSGGERLPSTAERYSPCSSHLLPAFLALCNLGKVLQSATF